MDKVISLIDSNLFTPDNDQNNIIESGNLRDALKSRGFVEADPVVRFNTNNYPYLVFYNDKGETSSIYFSKSWELSEGDKIDNLSTLGYVVVENAEGEERVKISKTHSGERVAL